jgi:RNA polymerase sigma-70 factor, ECF subfamily
MDEEDIKQLLLSDYSAALEQIYDFAGSELHGYLIGLTGSTHDAEELMNDLFIRIIDKRKKLAQVANLKAYLFRMTANMAWDSLRRKQKHSKSLSEYSVIIEANENSEVSDDEKAQLNMALASLPPEQREAIVMKFFLKKTFAEIATILNISENTVTSRYRYALQKLKAFLGDENCTLTSKIN